MARLVKVDDNVVDLDQIINAEPVIFKNIGEPDGIGYRINFINGHYTIFDPQHAMQAKKDLQEAVERFTH